MRCIKGALVSGGNVTYDSVAPLINDLIGSIDTATSSLAAIPLSRRHAARQSGDELADLVAEIVEVR